MARCLGAVIDIHPRRVAQVLALVLALLGGAALAPSTIAAPNADPTDGHSLAGSGPRGWAELLARVVPEPSRRPQPHARFAQARVVSLYGYPSVPTMGALGEVTPDEAAARVGALVAIHRASAPQTRVTGALHLIVAVAEVRPGPDGSYLARLDPAVIDRYLAAARAHDLLLYLDVQIGWGDPLEEARRLEPFLRDPDVQLSLDPEFATKRAGVAPGKVLGTLDAADVNRVQAYLASLVRQNGLPPKMLVLHQFVDSMLSQPDRYDRLPEVEIAIDMDGYGSVRSKLDHYEQFSLAPYSARPGIKLFYRWDAPVLTPEQLSALAQPPGLVIYQ